MAAISYYYYYYTLFRGHNLRFVTCTIAVVSENSVGGVRYSLSAFKLYFNRCTVRKRESGKGKRRIKLNRRDKKKETCLLTEFLNCTLMRLKSTIDFEEKIES